MGVTKLALTYLLTGLFVLAFSACDSDDDDDDSVREASATDLQNKTFSFDGGLIDEDFAGQTVVLTVGDFSADGDDDSNTAVFSLTNEGSTLGGTVTLGVSCVFTSTFGALDGEAPVAIEPPESDIADPCTFNPNDGSLEIVVDGENVRSGPGASVDVVFDLDMTLSPDFEVEPALPLDDRTEAGTANLRLLSGNILEYSLTVSNVDQADILTNTHIHPGDVTVNGPPFITLVNQPVQFGRTSNILFDDQSAVRAAIVLTSDEADALGDPASPFYLNLHSNQAAAGLLRGQLRKDIVLASNVPLSPDNEVELERRWIDEGALSN